MAKNLILSPILARFAQICTPKIFSWVLPLLDIKLNVTSYHRMQCQEKLMIQT